MASTILKSVSMLRNISQGAPSLASLRRSLCTETITTSSGSIATKTRGSLLSKLSHIGNPSTSIVPVLDKWAPQGTKFRPDELRFVIKTLRSRRRFTHALQVSEWLYKRDMGIFSSSDYPVHLELIGKVRGVKSAETFFNTLSVAEEEKGKLYGALLHCYGNEGMTEKSLSLFQKMKDLGIASTLAYNGIMNLYKKTNQVEKIPEVLLEMKKDGILPNSFSYNICIDVYGITSDLENMEKLLKEMESQPHIPAEWQAYSKMANLYIKAGESEKALIHLKKCEEMVGKDALGYNFLISHYADLGSKEEVTRLWKIQNEKRNKKVLNMDYVVMIGSLVKLDDLEEAERILKDWESSSRFYDFRVPNVLLIAYCKKRLTENAESMILKMVAKEKTPIPNSWSIVSTGYLEEENMEKALECMKKAISLQSENLKWKPKSRVVVEILDWVAENGEVEEVEGFMKLVKNIRPTDRELYHALIRACVKLEKEVDELLEAMKSDGIDCDDETHKILNSSSGMRMI